MPSSVQDHRLHSARANRKVMITHDPARYGKRKGLKPCLAGSRAGGETTPNATAILRLKFGEPRTQSAGITTTASISNNMEARASLGTGMSVPVGL